MALSDLAVRKARATGKDYTLTDIDGLSLAVSATGGKSWHFRYYWLDRQKRMSLGTYPEVSLREARALKDKARALLTSGVNPKTHRKRRPLGGVVRAPGFHYALRMYETFVDFPFVPVI